MILSIETSTHICSIALHQTDGSLVALHEFHQERKHAERLTLMIESVLNSAQCAFTDLSAIAVGAGPGSYTGLRIGISTAKGLCTGLKIPLIGVSSLKAWAAAALPWSKTDDFVCPLMDARRMEVFTGIFDASLNVVVEESAEVVDEKSFKEELEKARIIFIGDAVGKVSEAVKHPNAIFIPNQLPSAREIGQLATQKWKNEEFEDLAYFEPNYGKEFYTTAKKMKL